MVAKYVKGANQREARQRGYAALGERAVNRFAPESGKRSCKTSGKQWGVKPISVMISWRSLRESNPSFQIENLTS